eukprot:1372074-Amorphochlora_amoeboformis.AAC.1
MKYACYGRLSAGFRVMLFASNPIKEHELEGKGKVRNENTDPEQENELVLHFDVNKVGFHLVQKRCNIMSALFT